MTHSSDHVPVEPSSPELHEVLTLLCARTGHDFSGYKENTIIRRIDRRMSATHIDDMSGYVRYLAENPGEAEILFKELLIEVTDFFRDPAAFESLREKVLPELFRIRAPDAPLRVWVAACSTGEEAYSVAMLLQDYMDENHFDFRAQILATDIVESAIEIARAGAYNDSIVSDVPERYRRFLTREGSVHQVTKPIREMIVFAAQNLIKDPPFSGMDLICCRNLLIYMRPELQKQVLTLLHGSLKPEGFLFLGSSESLGEFGDRFTSVDRKWKIFRRPAGSK